MIHQIFSSVSMRVIPLLVLMMISSVASAQESANPIVSEDVIFEEVDGVLTIEAEHFYKQTLAKVRAWHITSSKATPKVEPDGDESHVAGAAGGAYLEVLPDTRRSDMDKLITNENFSNVPGKMAVLHYKVHINTPGKYYVWARAYSTGAEDNGFHVGIDGQWPGSGQRWQTVVKNKWHWESKQRTDKVHTGEPFTLFLDIEKAGPHEITISMREDGVELDRLMLTTQREEGKPKDLGPEVRVKKGKLPQPFEFVKPVAAADAQEKETEQPAGAGMKYPDHWGEPPQAQTFDLVPLPGGYGEGSSTLARWIQQNVDKDHAPIVGQRQPHGDGAVSISGELKQWHKVTLSMQGPFAHERDRKPNPFTDYLMTVTFMHESGTPVHRVPGYFAADGDAANSSAQSGTIWRAHLSPDKPGKWSYAISFVQGEKILAHEEIIAKPVKPFDGGKGEFTIAATDKAGRDFRARGRLQYVGGHHLRFEGSGDYFLKAGPDAPETLLAYADFDDTISPKKNLPLKTWKAHERDFKQGDPAWKNGKGKGLIGALNYLASKGCNSFSFLPYNAGGDGDNIWPFVSRDAKLHYDCSKLDQWQIVFDHATNLGLHLHFKLQENEMDDNRLGVGTKDGKVKESLDGGKLGLERRLYCREMIARFGHELGMLWNIGEENTQSAPEQRDMIRYLHETDPYQHNIAIHSYPNQQDKVYMPLLGKQSLLTGASLQNSWSAAHQQTLKWVQESSKAGRPWVVCNDEQNPASDGVPPDPGYEGHDGFAQQGGKKYSMHDVRKLCLWGTLMAGGGGVEYYFGYKLPQNDLICEDFRSRDKSWDYCRIAISFFKEHRVPFWQMKNENALVGNAGNDNSRYCLAKKDEIYLVYLPEGGEAELDLSEAKGAFKVQWFNPRDGGAMIQGKVTTATGGAKVPLGQPPADAKEDWLIVVKR